MNVMNVPGLQPMPVAGRFRPPTAKPGVPTTTGGPQMPRTGPGHAEPMPGATMPSALSPGNGPPTPQPLPGPGLSLTGSPAPATQSFGPGNDLRATQFNPTPSLRLGNARGLTDAAANGVQNFNVGTQATGNADAIQGRLAQGPVAFRGPSERVAKMGGLVDNAAGSLANVDRFKLAQEKFDQSAADSQPAYEFANRVATQRAAAGGKLGSGMLRTDYGNLDLAREREFNATRSGFLRDALEGSIGDQFNKTSALSNLEGQAFAQDRTTGAAQEGLDSNNRAYEGQIRRDALSMGLGLANNEAGNALDKFNVARSAEGDAYNQDVGARTELRGERGYQDSLANRATSDALSERQQQEREMAQRASLLLGGSQAAGQSSSEDMNALQQAIAAWMARRNGEG